MDLKITSYNNYFKLQGILHKKNVNLLQAEFSNAFEMHKSITLSVEGLESVDRDGVNALTDLHRQSIQKNVQLAIVGLGCKELYDHFRSCNEAA